MCPRCNIGPVDIGGCDNLETHHLERVGGGDEETSSSSSSESSSHEDADSEDGSGRLSKRRVRIIRNECPCCKFFGATVNDWKVWDGVIRRMPPRAAPPAE
jgi:hypothetical protein